MTVYPTFNSSLTKNTAQKNKRCQKSLTTTIPSNVLPNSDQKMQTTHENVFFSDPEIT